MLRASLSSEHGVFGEAVDVEIEGDGPLGIVFRKSGEGVAIRSVVRGPAPRARGVGAVSDACDRPPQCCVLLASASGGLGATCWHG